LRARHFQQIHFYVIFLHAWITIFGNFSYLREYVSLLKYGYNVRCKQFWPKRYRHSIFNTPIIFWHSCIGWISQCRSLNTIDGRFDNYTNWKSKTTGLRLEPVTIRNLARRPLGIVGTIKLNTCFEYINIKIV